MTLLSVSNLTKYYGADLIFQEVSFHVSNGEKVALVGVNGAGKSTLLKIIAGQVSYDEGTVHVVRGNRVAYLAQEALFSGKHTLWQEMESALAHLMQLQNELRELEQRLADTSAPDWELCMHRYGEVTSRFEHGGGYHIEQRIEYMLQHLGFDESHYHQPIALLSGGQKTRAAMAATLLSDPDLLLLDEPTNHLDLQALEWLEEFLQNWYGTLIVISHDRYFLDRVTRRTLDMSFGRVEDYPAGYNRYLELKAERLELQLKQFESQQEFIARTEEFIRRYKAGQRSKEAKGREKRLNRLKEQHLIQRPKEQKSLRLHLESKLRSGDLVLTFDALVVGYAKQSDARKSDKAHALLNVDRLELHRGERVAIIGPNGCGKTTLLRTLVGEIAPLQGSFLIGHNVAIGYYAQGHESLNMDATVLDEMLRVSPHLGEAGARHLLGRFLFSGDDVFKQVGDLSGGERNRVALAQLTLKSSNLLVMDEPTNHLDIQAREALEEVLNAYTGTILFVSHDRFFIDALADKLWLVQDGKLIEYLGLYREYQEQRAKEQTFAEQQAKQKECTPSPDRVSVEERQRKKQLKELEAHVQRLEQEFAQVKDKLDTASLAQNVDQITLLGKQYVALEQQLQQKYDEWMELSE